MADIRTAAQREADRPQKLGSMLGGHRAGFIEGAVWSAERLTPTREQLAEALWNLPINVITMKQLKEQAASGSGDYREALDYVYEQADAVLALIAGLAEGGGGDK